MPIITAKSSKRARQVSATIHVLRYSGEEETEIPVEVTGYYEPAQNGGQTDPSWDANITFETAIQGTSGSSIDIGLTADEQERAVEALWQSIAEID